MVITMAKLRMAHASRLGQQIQTLLRSLLRPGPKGKRRNLLCSTPGLIHYYSVLLLEWVNLQPKILPCSVQMNDELKVQYMKKKIHYLIEREEVSERYSIKLTAIQCLAHSSIQCLIQCALNHPLILIQYYTGLQ